MGLWDDETFRLQNWAGADNNTFTVSSGGDISFYEDTGTTAKLFWDASAESLGIGTASPDKLVHLKTSAVNTAVLRIESTALNSYPFLSLKNDAREYQLTAHGPLGDIFTIYDGTAGSHRFVIDSSGNVGIGTSSLDNKVNIQESALSGRGASNSNTSLTIEHATDTGIQFFSATQTQLRFGDAASTAAGSIIYEHGEDKLRLNSGSLLTVATAGSERLRIDSSGSLLVGTSSSTAPHTLTSGSGGAMWNNSLYISIARTSDSLFLNRLATDGGVARFYRAGGTDVGSISVTSSATSYNTSSDQRLKENIVDAPSASDDIDAIQVRSFDWKADGSHQKYGMVAQELQTVAPEAVSQGETEEDMMGVDYSKLVPMLIKEIQSLRNRVAQLEE
jgi:hypothetical protein